MLWFVWIVFSLLVGGGVALVSRLKSEELAFVLILVGIILCLPLIVFSWAVQVRRCHDLGWSGWWLLLPHVSILGLLPVDSWSYRWSYAYEASFHYHFDFFSVLSWIRFVPVVVGTVASIVLFFAFGFLDGQPGRNRYGPDPRRLRRS